MVLVLIVVVFVVCASEEEKLVCIGFFGSPITLFSASFAYDSMTVDIITTTYNKYFIWWCGAVIQELKYLTHETLALNKCYPQVIKADEQEKNPKWIIIHLCF